MHKLQTDINYTCKLNAEKQSTYPNTKLVTIIMVHHIKTFTNTETRILYYNKLEATVQQLALSAHW
jgi:hypothetical protein